MDHCGTQTGNLVTLFTTKPRLQSFYCFVEILCDILRCTHIRKNVYSTGGLKSHFISSSHISYIFTHPVLSFCGIDKTLFLWWKCYILTLEKVKNKFQFIMLWSNSHTKTLLFISFPYSILVLGTLYWWELKHVNQFLPTFKRLLKFIINMSSERKNMNS